MSILNNNYLIKANIRINKNLLYCDKNINYIIKLSLRDKRVKSKYFIKI